MSIDIHFSYTLPIVTIDFPTWDAQKSQKPWPGRSGDTANRVACNVYIYIVLLLLLLLFFITTIEIIIIIIIIIIHIIIIYICIHNNYIHQPFLCTHISYTDLI